MGPEDACGPIRNVAVIGAGPRGRSFCFACAAAGAHVFLEDVLSSRLHQTRLELEQAPPALLQRVHLVYSVEDAVREADLAIDFVPDELESKLEILCLMDRMAPPRTLFCVPTHLSITDLAACTYRAPQCVGIRPFADASGHPLHLVRGVQTSSDTVLRVHGLLQRLGAQVHVTQDIENPAEQR